MYYDKSSIGAKAYLALAGEMLEKDLQEAKLANNTQALEGATDRTSNTGANTGTNTVASAGANTAVTTAVER